MRACLAGPRSAGELVAIAGLAAPSVSEHLKVLRKTGLLVLEARGRHRYYRTDPEVVEVAVAQLLALIAPEAGNDR